MATFGKVRVRIHCTDSLSEKMEAVYDRIAQRAYERWFNSRISKQPGMEFWSAAERELIAKPETEVREWGHGVTVQIACPEIDPSEVRLFMSSTEALALAPMLPSTVDRWLFRHIRFRNPIDNIDASAEFERGLLSINATFINAPDDAKMHFRVA